MPKIYNIPKPCNQGRQNMSEIGENKFYKSCRKEVVDFTNKSPRNIIKYLNQNPKTYGHFKSSQRKDIKNLKSGHNKIISKNTEDSGFGLDKSGFCLA